MSYRGQHVVILGLARQGTALARYLAGQGARVTISDSRPAAALQARLAELADLPIEYVLGGHPETLLDGTNLLCLSGGVAADLPLVQAAVRRGIPLSNDSQIFLEATPATVIGITGSAGKTTTTALVGEMLKAANALTPGPFPLLQARERGVGDGGRGQRTTWVGGNIGNPLIALVDQMQAGDLAVMELSSFQLEIMTRSPHVAAILNTTPNHLDRHGTMEAYAQAKSRILRFQGPQDSAVLGWDDPQTRALAPQAPGRVSWFSSAAPVDEGAWLEAGWLQLRRAGHDEQVAPASEIRLRGAHNRLNVLAACAIAGAAGAQPAAMRAAIAEFTGVAHRLELVRERGGVQWYNDSIATAPERAAAAVQSFDEPLVLLLGGRDKDLPWGQLAGLVAQRVRHVVAFGEARGLVTEALHGAGYTALTQCEGLAAAVQAAAGLAQPGDVVLLAPGGTSFDEFADFAERGERFRELVNNL